MSRRCVVTGKKVMTGNNVSHANNKTRRVFLPNVQDTRLFSESLGRDIALRVSMSGLRTIDHKGGLDAWLVSAAPTSLDSSLRRVRAEILRKKAARAIDLPAA